MAVTLLLVKAIGNYNSYIRLIGGREMLVWDLHEIGNKLLAIRKKYGMTQSEVAESAGLSYRTYADIERGTVNMRLETVFRICDALHITPDEILTKDDEELTAKQRTGKPPYAFCLFTSSRLNRLVEANNTSSRCS